MVTLFPFYWLVLKKALEGVAECRMAVELVELG